MEELPEGAIPLREAALKLQVSVETLRRRAQRMQKRGESGPYIKRVDEWFVIVPADADDVQDMLRDRPAPPDSTLSTPAAQFGRVIEQAIAPYAARLEEIAIELGATRNELQHERERREAAERQRDELMARLDTSRAESPPKRANVAPEGVQREIDPSTKRRGWLARLFLGDE